VQLVVFAESLIPKMSSYTTPRVHDDTVHPKRKLKKGTIALISVSAGVLVAGVTLAIVLPLVLTKKKVFHWKNGGVSSSSCGNSVFNGEFTVTSSNNVFAFYLQTGPSYTVQITEGTYSSGTELAQEIQNALNAAVQSGGWTVTWNNTLSSFTITNATKAWDTCDDPDSIYRLIGFPSFENGCGTDWKFTQTGSTI
jgi:hypothetical protein